MPRFSFQKIDRSNLDHFCDCVPVNCYSHLLGLIIYQKNNIAAAKLIAELVKTCLGPRGMDKMLVSSIGDATITNDGTTILKEMDVEHPAAKILVEVAKSVDNEVGDGITSSVVFAGAPKLNTDKGIFQNCCWRSISIR